jgi:putative hydrolase of the HAD superfamily
MTIRAVVLDFGGVFTASPFEVARAAGAAAGLGPDAAVEMLFGPYDDDTDHPWHRAERGELSITDCRDEILALSTASGGTALDLWEVFRLMGERVSGVRDVVVGHTRRLRAAGLRTGLLTNNIVEAREFWRPLLPLDELFDDIVDSCEVGLRKPDARIYRLALDRLGIEDPAEAVFLDDWPGNVVAARRVGMTGIVVGDDPAPAFVELEHLLGLEPV